MSFNDAPSLLGIEWLEAEDTEDVVIGGVFCCIYI